MWLTADINLTIGYLHMEYYYAMGELMRQTIAFCKIYTIFIAINLTIFLCDPYQIRLIDI